MEHALAHDVGVYIGLLLLACIVGIAANYIANVPYTIALTLVGLGVGIFHIGPGIDETGFGKDMIFFVMLPPLLFQGALHLEMNHLLDHFAHISLFAIVGVVVSTLAIGAMMYYAGGLYSWTVALLFGAIMSPTDPVSVLALFKSVGAPRSLKYMMEGESLFNDGTGIVLFAIILGMIQGGGHFSVGRGALEFFTVAGGGFVLGAAVGLAAYAVLKKIDDHLLENAICLVVAYGAFWLAEQFHFSGVIATVVAGLLIGNYGRRFSMAQKTVETVETFFDALAFLVNSLLFILMGLELQTLLPSDIMGNLQPLGVAIIAMIAARALVVYPLYFGLNFFEKDDPPALSHALWWGGLRGSIPLALLLGMRGIPQLDEWRPALLVAGFGAVFFSLVVQGLTMKPLLIALKITGKN